MAIPPFLMNRRIRVALGALVFVGGVWFFFFRGGGTSYDTLVVHPTEFSEQVSVSGSVKAAQNVDLGFSQSGRIAGVYAKVGDPVSAGTVLAQIENGDLRAAVSQKEAALAAQKATLDLLLAGTRPEEIAVKEAQVHSDEIALAQSHDAEINALQNAYTQSDDAVRNKADQFFNNPRQQSTSLAFDTSNAQLKVNIANERVSLEQTLVAWQSNLTALTPASDLAQTEAEAERDLALVIAFLSDVNQALNLANYTTTFTQSVIADYISDVATGRTNVNTARTTLTTAITTRQGNAATLNKDAKDLALARAGSTEQDIANQRALVASAQADVESARSQLSKTIVTAPFSGIITRMDAKVGAIVSPSDTGISMISTGRFQVEAYIPEVQVTGLEVGDSATATLDAYGANTPFKATVVAIDPAETKQDGVSTYKTTLQFNEPDTRIKSGMTASVVITTSTSQGALVVPRGAIFQKGGHDMLQLIRGSDIVNVPVEISGTSTLGNVQILSGLSDGDTVVLTPDTSR